MIKKVEGWKIFKEDYAEDGKLLDVKWFNIDAGYDTAAVIVQLSRTSLARWNQFTVLAKVERHDETIVFGRVDFIPTPSKALEIAYSFMKRNKYIVKLK